MLHSRTKGFAVMNEKLDSYSFKDESLELCKRYCIKGDLIAEQIPYKIGYSIRVVWHRWYKPINFNSIVKNIFWIHWSINKEFSHKVGKIVYKK